MKLPHSQGDVIGLHALDQHCWCVTVVKGEQLGGCLVFEGCKFCRDLVQDVQYWAEVGSDCKYQSYLLFGVSQEHLPAFRYRNGKWCGSSVSNT